MKKLNLRTIVKYLVYLMLFLLLTNTKTIHGLRPFGLGLFVALVYSRQNILVLAPMYIVASIIANPSWAGVVLSAVPAVVFTIAYWLHFRAGKSINMLFANLYTLLSQIPYIILTVKSIGVFTAILTVAVTQVFAYCAIIVLYAILIRGLKYRLTVDELISGAVLLSSVALGLYQCSIYQFNFYYMVCAFLLLLSAYMFSSSVPLVLAVVMGLGASFSNGEIILVATAVCWAVAVIMFRNTSVYLSALAMIMVDIVFGFYFNAYATYSYINIIALAVGVVVFLILPKKYKHQLSGYMGNVREAYAGKTIVNRNRLDVSNRLFSIANVFEEMQLLLQDETQIIVEVDDNRKRMAKDIALGYCAKCPDYAECYSALGTDTSVILFDILETAQAKGRATIIDMPPFVTSRCRRINGLLQAINDRLDSHNNYKKLSKSLDNSKLMLATQMGGMAEILNDLGHDIKRCVSFDTNREKLIIDELIYHNIVCREAMVYGESGDINITVIVRNIDAEKQILPRIVSKVMRTKLVREGSPDIFGDFASVHLVLAPKYDIVFGEAVKNREGEIACGDCRSIQKIGEKKIVLAVCDGMGSGKPAEEYSSNAIQMIENFYRAGFSNDVVLALANKLLSLKNEENFSALDLCILDLNSGGCDFIKLGAPYNLIKRRDCVEIISSHSLPIGIIEDARPAIERKVLFNGDIIILISDGISDVLTEAMLVEIIESHKGVNPQSLADFILSSAVTNGATDDATVLVARVYNKA